MRLFDDLGRGLRLDDRPVFLLRQPLLELAREPAGCLLGLGPENHAGSGSVEPVDDAQINRAGIIGTQIPPHRRFESFLALWRPFPLHKLARGFVECQAVLVLKEDG